MAALTTRINTLMLLLLVLMAGAIIAMLATRAYGGPLDPTGPAASTDGVRGPGTPISSLPFPITTAGYYYVTRPLTGGASQDGITVSASNVTIDLGGFTIGGGAAAGAGIAIGAFRNVTIRNGAIRAWLNGIAGAACGDCRVDGIQASSNVNTGIKLGPQSEVSNCNASLNTTGIDGNFMTVRNCTTSENGAAGIVVANNSVVEDSRVNSNPGLGISMEGNYSTVRNTELSGNGTDIEIFPGGLDNVLYGNVYCSLVNSGTNTAITGNVDRVDAC